jgi:hypothetical protein
MTFDLWCINFFESDGQLDIFPIHKCECFTKEGLSFAFVVGNEQHAGELIGTLSEAQKDICDFFVYVPVIKPKILVFQTTTLDDASAENLEKNERDKEKTPRQGHLKIRLPLNAMLGIVLHRFTTSASYRQKHFQGSPETALLSFDPPPSS